MVKYLHPSKGANDINWLVWQTKYIILYGNDTRLLKEQSKRFNFCGNDTRIFNIKLTYL